MQFSESKSKPGGLRYAYFSSSLFLQVILFPIVVHQVMVTSRKWDTTVVLGSQRTGDGTAAWLRVYVALWTKQTDP